MQIINWIALDAKQREECRSLLREKDAWTGDPDPTVDSGFAVIENGRIRAFGWISPAGERRMFRLSALACLPGEGQIASTLLAAMEDVARARGGRTLTCRNGSAPAVFLPENAYVPDGDDLTKVL